jgi:H+-transporting ATPase
MSMATDNVRPSLKPDKFDMRSLFGVGGAIGLLMTIESAIFAVPALSYFNLIGNMEKIYTFGFAYINFVGFSTILILREQNHFWKSRPSKFLSIVILAEVLLVTAVSMLGVLELAPLGYLPVLAILSYSLLTSLLINDPIKVYLIDKLKSTKNEKRSN